MGISRNRQRETSESTSNQIFPSAAKRIPDNHKHTQNIQNQTSDYAGVK